MTRRLTTMFLAVALAALTVGLGAANAAPRVTFTKQKVVPIVMADPGCHWFSVGGKNVLSLKVKGATTFRNLDEAALVFSGKGFHKTLAVGKTIKLSKRGTYRITMVKQAPDDNHLKLVVS